MINTISQSYSYPHEDGVESENHIQIQNNDLFQKEKFQPASAITIPPQQNQALGWKFSPSKLIPLAR